IVVRKSADDVAHHLVDQRSAIDGDRVVKPRRSHEVIHLLDVGDKKRPHILTGKAKAVEIDVFAADVGAHADNVAFIGGDYAQFEALKKPAELGKLLLPLPPDLNGEHQLLAAAEAKGNQHRRELSSAPVRSDQVERLKPRKIVAAGLPARGIVAESAPVEVTHVVQ